MLSHGVRSSVADTEDLIYFISSRGSTVSCEDAVSLVNEISCRCEVNAADKKMIRIAFGWSFDFMNSFVSMIDQNYSDEPQIVEDGLKVLSSMTITHDGIVEKLGSAGMCLLLLKILDLYGSSSFVIRELAMCTVANLTDNNKSNIKRFENVGVSELLVKLIVGGPIQSSFPEQGVRCIANLGIENMPNREKMGVTGASELLVKLLDIYGDTNISFCKLTMRAITNLVASHMNNRERVGIASGCLFLVRKLSANGPHNLELAVQGLRAITSLAEDSFVNKERMGVAGACSCVMKILRLYVTESCAEEEIAECGCLAILTLMTGNAGNTFTIRTLGTEAVLTRLVLSNSEVKSDTARDFVKAIIQLIAT